MQAKYSKVLSDIKELKEKLKNAGFKPVIIYMTMELHSALKSEFKHCHDGDETFDGLTVLKVRFDQSTFDNWTIAVNK